MQPVRSAMIRRLTALSAWMIAISFFFVSCGQRNKPVVDPVGVWENTTHWGNNKITLKIRKDSIMLFKAERGYCPGQRYFVSAGKWHIEKDSILVMDQADDSTHFDLAEIFPELVQGAKDYNNVTVLTVSARLIIRDSLLYDVSPEGTAVPDRTYRKTTEDPMPH